MPAQKPGSKIKRSLVIPRRSIKTSSAEARATPIKFATKGNALKLSKMAEKNAKETLTRKIFESETD